MGMPPNYVHSLDSTHMMLTSLFCERYLIVCVICERYLDVVLMGKNFFRSSIPFVSVHDSYWTPACFVNQMNKVTFHNDYFEFCLVDLQRAICESSL